MLFRKSLGKAAFYNISLSFTFSLHRWALLSGNFLKASLKVSGLCLLRGFRWELIAHVRVTVEFHHHIWPKRNSEMSFNGFWKNLIIYVWGPWPEKKKQIFCHDAGDQRWILTTNVLARSNLGNPTKRTVVSPAAQFGMKPCKANLTCQ